MIKHINITIHGKVQGIFFRASAKELADKLDIKGFAKNRLDGSVYIEAEGEPESLERFIKWCHKGPTIAKVEKVEISEEVNKNFREFMTN